MKEYPEESGHVNSPTFVKGNPLNNESYIEKCCEAMPHWANILRDTHKKIEAIAPGYNISQIKDKFGELRYYWDFPTSWREDGVVGILPEHEETRKQVDQIIWDAEKAAWNAR